MNVRITQNSKTDRSKNTYQIQNINNVYNISPLTRKILLIGIITFISLVIVGLTSFIIIVKIDEKKNNDNNNVSEYNTKTNKSDNYYYFQQI